MNWRALFLALPILLSCRRAPVPRRHEVEIRDMAFVPARIELSAGDTVIWTDRDLVPHTATADSGAAWEVGPILASASGVFVPGGAGTFTYHCRFHPVMHGTLVVVAQR